ncbi:MAG: MoaD/ThiS family protein [Hyphomicrobiaceae bacterium]
MTLIGNLSRFADGEREFQIEANSIARLFRRLAERHPGLAPHLEQGLAVAIDGQIYQDALLVPIGPDSEVHILPQIAGG